MLGHHELRRAGALTCAVAALLGSLATAGRAEAYCRSTTCTGDCPRDENECKTTGQPLYWSSSCVGISLNSSGGAYVPYKYFQQAAEKALLEWSDLPCGGADQVASIAFSQLDDITCDDAEYNDGDKNANGIVFQNTKWVYTSEDNNVAKTTVTFDADTGEILDADIEINQANNNLTVSDEVIEYDLQSILTHEIGHLIGLDHSPDSDATMYASYEPGTVDQRSLSPDDMEAVCAAYPPSRVAQCAPQPRGGLAIECLGEGATDSGGCAVARAPSPSSSRLGLFLAAVLTAFAMRRPKINKRGALS